MYKEKLEELNEKVKLKEALSPDSKRQIQTQVEKIIPEILKKVRKISEELKSDYGLNTSQENEAKEYTLEFLKRNLR